jgi:RNA polymerase sigma-70 factor (ECF subfamily)
MGNDRLTMEQFLASVERRAFRMAQIATGNSDEALDIVQDAMLKLVAKYQKKPSKQWKPLFYRILQNRIRDWYRRTRVKNRWRTWLNPKSSLDENNPQDPLENLAASDDSNPAHLTMIGDASKALEAALQKLSLRQQQAFLLRAWEGLSVAETAVAMQCSDGSVKTHYSRAIQTLRDMLEDHWP